MKPLSILVALVIVACHDAPTASSASTATVDGAWQFTEQANASCDSTGVGASQVYYFTIPPTSATTVDVTAGWDVVQPPRALAAAWTVTGTINTTTHAVTLNFWKLVLSEGEEFDGVLNADGTISGTTTDPKPGYAANWTTTSCVRTTTGRRQ